MDFQASDVIGALLGACTPGDIRVHYTAQFVSSWDPMTGVLKSVAFGLAIALISCYKGFTCSGGASGVGRASTESFVASFLAIIVINLVLAQFLGTVQRLLDPDSMKTLIS
jgi:phospholipid/cholesterol/gamma-HCH transport system permease protein